MKFSGLPVAAALSGAEITALSQNQSGTLVSVQASLSTILALSAQPATATPLIDGTAAVGVSLLFARQDHVHPSDTSRAALAGLSTQVFNVANATTATEAMAYGQFTSVLGVANGVATLDSGGHIPISQIPATVVGGMNYQGTWNASTNTPALASGVGTKGYFYKVSVAGTTTIDGNSAWNVGDLILFDGTVWDKIDGIPSEVLSVAGRTGAVILSVSDVSGAAPLASPVFTGAVTASNGLTVNTSPTLIYGGSGIALTGNGFMQIGASTAFNLVFDTANIQARSNGAITPLRLNSLGGAVYTKNNTLDDGSGNAAITGLLTLGTGSTIDLLLLANSSGAQIQLQQNTGSVNTLTFSSYNGGVVPITTLTFNATTTSFAGSLTTAHNTLDDGSGNATFGSSTANHTIILNGINSGTGGGASLNVQNGGVTQIALGNYSNITGTAYDATPTLYTSSSLRFYVNGSTRATIDGNGSLGFAVTPSAWDSNGNIELQGSRSITFDSSYCYLNANAFHNSGVWKYVSADYATQYIQAAGVHAWNIAPSGGAGTTISFTQAMTLDNSGNLLVGTTSTAAGQIGFSVIGAGSNPTANLFKPTASVSGSAYYGFYYNATEVGSITQSGTTGVSYNVTSDARLKDDLGLATASRICSITIHDFKWKSDGSKSRGVFAQEAHKIIPEAVRVGDSDIEVKEVWQVDYTKLIPDLILELQALRTGLNQLKARSIL